MDREFRAHQVLKVLREWLAQSDLWVRMDRLDPQVHQVLSERRGLPELQELLEQLGLLEDLQELPVELVRKGSKGALARPVHEESKGWLVQVVRWAYKVLRALQE